MKPIELSHAAADFLEMYGHMIRTLKKASEETEREDLMKTYKILKNHRQKMIYLLDKVYRYLCEKEGKDVENEEC